MQLTFLEASTPLTKTYEKKPNGEIQGGMYPGVRDFTSRVENVDSLEEFSKALTKYAANGGCLLSSSLTRPIVNESRAKLSDPTEPRRWIVLDVDGLEYNTIDEFITEVLPEQFHNTSYVVQYSPSHGIKSGIRAHLFYMLDTPLDPKIIKNWLKWMNLATKPLRDQVELSKSAMSLSLRLDIVANDNGRIIYITPPECVGFSDPVTSRIELKEKDHDLISFNFASVSQAKLQQDYRDLVNDLRKDAGLPEKKAQTYYEYGADGSERLRRDLTQPAKITGFHADNDYFMRCNIDGGDSWAYYYYRHRAEWLYNFKGEPALHLPTLDPEFYAQVAKPDADKLKERENRPFVFRDMLSDKFYTGIRKGAEIIVQPHVIGSESKIEHYFAEFGTSPPDPLPTWERMFDPTLEAQWVADKKVFNAWRPTTYMNEATFRSLPPETITRVIGHVLGNDGESYERFINWLAYIYQTRRKTGTAWILHGVPGTGKGVLYNYVIRPLFGHDYCETKQVRDLRANFNGWMETALFVNVDETNSQDAGNEESAVIEALKMWITDPIISIEAKHQNARMAKNFTNFIFTSNEHGALPIQEGDRRFNVAPRQESPIVLDDKDLETIRGELLHFAGFLSGVDVDASLATRSMENAAKMELQEAARTSIDEFVHAVAAGDLLYFIEGLNEHTTEYQAKEEFKQAIEQWKQDAKDNQATKMTTQQLRAAYVVMCAPRGDMKINKFNSMMSKKGYPPKQRRVDGHRWRGWIVDWQLSDDDKAQLKMHVSAVKSNEDIEKEIKNEING